MSDSSEVRERYFPSQKEIYPQIYAYRLTLEPDEMKVGFTTKQNVRDRIAEQIGTANLDYTLEYFAPAIKNTGETFTDKEVHRWLESHGAVRVERKEVFKVKSGRPPEIFKNCTVSDVKAAVESITTGTEISANRINDYKPRKEQADAINRTIYYFNSHQNPSKTPKFLWNAKMRFGKTYAALELARRMELKKVLIITFKVEVKDSWKNELLGHRDFVDYHWVDVKNRDDIKSCEKFDSIVAFGSFQDLLGRNNLGGIKYKNEWVHEINWDLIIFDEYHYGSWREKAKDLFDDGSKDMQLLDDSILPITSNYMLYLSGTPFRAINVGEFVDDQIYNWTYTDEQQAKYDWNDVDGANPYASMPEMILMTYQLPEACTQVALKGEQNEFDLNEFFRAECDVDSNGKKLYDSAHFVHENEVQRWLDIIRGKADISTELQKAMGASKPVLPYFDVTLRDTINHTLWYMNSVASCYAMRNLLQKDVNKFYSDYQVIVAAGSEAGLGSEALIPVRAAMGNPLETKTITITCSKLTTGVTVRPWSAIFMLSSISTPEAYFQSAFRVQSGWTIKSDNADEPDIIKKLKCYVFDFAPNRALRQLSDYACSLNPDYTRTAEDKVSEFIKFLPVLAFDGSSMSPINANEILDFVASGTTATLLARKWNSALLVNVTNQVFQKIIDNENVKNAIMNIEGFRNMNSDIFQQIINKSEHVRKGRSGNQDSGSGTARPGKELTEEEQIIKSQRKKIQENLMKFATRIPLFMYLTDYREETLQDVIRKIDVDLFKKVTGITVDEFEILIDFGVFNSAAMNEAVAAFRRYEESSLSYAGIDKHYGERVGLWDISVKHDELHSLS